MAEYTVTLRRSVRSIVPPLEVAMPDGAPVGTLALERGGGVRAARWAFAPTAGGGAVEAFELSEHRRLGRSSSYEVRARDVTVATIRKVRGLRLRLLVEREGRAEVLLVSSGARTLEAEGGQWHVERRRRPLREARSRTTTYDLRVPDGPGHAEVAISVLAVRQLELQRAALT